MAGNGHSYDIERRLSDLLENRKELERFRFQGSTNRVYRIPTGESGEFVILKLLPARASELPRLIKRPIRNLLYGEGESHTGRRRAVLEVERYREWQRAGLPVPPLLETSIPGARVIQGLPYPTFYSILCELPVDTERRMEALRSVTMALAKQHRMARRLGWQSLVHRDPGPWNIMFDLGRNRTFWFDLEHPAEYPGMTVEDLCVRGLRIFTFGVLDHLSEHFDRVMETIADNYTPKATLRHLAVNLEDSAQRLPVRIASSLGLRRRRREQQERIAAKLRQLVGWRPSVALAPPEQVSRG